MSTAQYNLTNKTDYLQRKMFLDPAGPVTIQRFEEVKYNKLVKFEQEARGFFWVPEEVNLTKDAQDFKESSETVRHIFTSFCISSSWSVDSGGNICNFISNTIWWY